MCIDPFFEGRLRDSFYRTGHFLPISRGGGYKVCCQCSGSQVGEGSYGFYNFVCGLLVNFSDLIMAPLPLAVSDDPRLEFFSFNFPRE